MVGGIILIVITGLIAFFAVDALKQRFPYIQSGLLKRLYFYHLFLSLMYYLYVLFNRSDSKGYYNAASVAEDWFSLYGTSTTFIKFLAFPFVKYLSFSYEATMALFAFAGYLGFLYMYIFFKENIKFKHNFFGVDLLTLIFFLPNLHFWSGSLGKGSIIFLGIGLFFFGINHVKSRWLAVMIGGLIIYHVRPHVMLILLVSSALGFVFSSKGIAVSTRVIFLMGASVAFFFIYKDVLSLVGIDEEEFISQGLDLSHRAYELSKATSGIDINSYSLPEQLFAFLYRPLFFDAPGILGVIVSVENVFYLLITIRILSLKGLKFIVTGNFLIKSAFLSFFTISIALAQISGNLGLAIRQKSQIMILFLFVIISFLDKQKMIVYQRSLAQQMRKARAAVLRKEKAV